MKKLFFLLVLLLSSSIFYSQNVLNKIKDQAEKIGLKQISETKFRLKNNSEGSLFPTLSPGKYKVFALGGYSEVKNVDLFIFDYYSKEIIAKEDTEMKGITILNFDIKKTKIVEIKILNKKSTPESEYFDCYLLLTKY